MYSGSRYSHMSIEARADMVVSVVYLGYRNRAGQLYSGQKVQKYDKTWSPGNLQGSLLVPGKPPMVIFAGNRKYPANYREIKNRDW